MYLDTQVCLMKIKLWCRRTDQIISKTADLEGCSHSAVVSFCQKTVVTRQQDHGWPRFMIKSLKKFRNAGAGLFLASKDIRKMVIMLSTIVRLGSKCCRSFSNLFHPLYIPGSSKHIMRSEHSWSWMINVEHLLICDHMASAAAPITPKPANTKTTKQDWRVSLHWEGRSFKVIASSNLWEFLVPKVQVLCGVNWTFFGGGG